MFATKEPWHGFQPVDEQLNETMMGYWVQFATTGNPNCDGLPHWPAFSEAAFLELGDTIHADTGLEAEACQAFEEERS